MLITYHLSSGHQERGCAGFDCDTEAAKAHAYAIAKQAGQLFGDDHQQVYPLVCGFETDSDALLLHGQQGEVLDSRDVIGLAPEALSTPLASLCPDMPREIQ